MFPYLVLLRVGFSLPLNVATSAVGSYPTISTLPVRQSAWLALRFLMPSAVYFLCHFPSPHGVRLLAGTLLCGARTFLSPPPKFG